MSVAIPLTGTTGVVTGALSVTAPVYRADVQQFAGLLNMVGRRIMKSVAALSRG
jgi:DNA-binding IclR family transcriptional regulator